MANGYFRPPRSTEPTLNPAQEQYQHKILSPQQSAHLQQLHAELKGRKETHHPHLGNSPLPGPSSGPMQANELSHNAMSPMPEVNHRLNALKQYSMGKFKK